MVTEIPISKTKLLLMILCCVAFVVASIGILWYFGGFESLTASFYKIVAVIGILFFGGVGFFCLRKLFDFRPGLIIDSTGIIDNSSGVAMGRIYWDDIIDIGVAEVQKQKFVLVYLRNPQDYINAQTGVARARVLKHTFNHYDTPVSIASNTLKISFTDLHNLILSHFIAHKKIKV